MSSSTKESDTVNKPPTKDKTEYKNNSVNRCESCDDEISISSQRCGHCMRLLTAGQMALVKDSFPKQNK